MSLKSGVARAARTRAGLVTLALVGGLSLVAYTISSVSAQDARPYPPEAWQRELRMKVAGSFTVAAVGDLIVLRPISQWNDAGLQAALKLVQDADIGVGNFEASIVDEKTFKGPWGGQTGTKEVAADVKAMGFDLVNHAMNHEFDSGVEGMHSTDEWLDKAGVVHAGSGKNLDEARAAQFLELPKGRIGIVGAHAVGKVMMNTNLNDFAGANATYRNGNTGGKPGVNPLNLTTYYNVSQAEFDALKKVRDAMYVPPPGLEFPLKLQPDPPGRLQLLGTWFKVGPVAGEENYVMNPNDLREIMRSMRDGKQRADFMISTMHAHQGRYVSQSWTHETETPDFLRAYAKASIDNGADIYVGHGGHIIRGIEIYKNKPIFYNLGEFIRHMDITVGGQARFRQPAAGDPLGPEPTDTELVVAGQTTGPMSRRDAVGFQSLLSLSRYEDGQLVEVKIHPIDIRYDAPISQAGIPKIASSAIGKEILERLQKLSKEFGTTIAIENNVGIIRVPRPSSSQ